MSFENIVQGLVFTALNGNISAGVYDDPPFLPEGKPRQDFPFVIIGSDTSAPFDTDDTVGRRVTVTLHVWSRYQGMKEVKTVMGEIFDLLNRVEFTSAGYNILDNLATTNAVMMDPDGETRHGVMRFIFTIQKTS